MNKSLTLRQKATNFGGRFAGLTALAMAAAPAAFAQADLASAVTAEVDTAQLIAIGLIVMTVAGITMFIRSGRRVAN